MSSHNGNFQVVGDLLAAIAISDRRRQKRTGSMPAVADVVGRVC